MIRKPQSIAARLLNADIAISNTINNAEIQSYISPYGYDVAKLSEGKTLYGVAHQLTQAQEAKYGRQYASTIMLMNKFI